MPPVKSVESRRPTIETSSAAATARVPETAKTVRARRTTLIDSVNQPARM